MPRSLRSFFEEMSKVDKDWCLEITRLVHPSRFEVSALAKNLEDAGIEKALLFTNVTNLLGEKAEFDLLINTFARRSYCAVALGLAPEQWRMDLVEKYAALKSSPGEIKVVPASEAPCQEVIWPAQDLDLRRFPVPILHEKDAGPYFTMANVMRSRQGDFYDVSCTKNMIYGPRRVSCSANPRLNIRHLARIISEFEAADEPTPVALVQGHHPAFYLGGQALMPYGNNDYLTIAGFLGEPLRLTPSLTWGERFLVPADAEIIIEGEILPGVREKQNPFGEFSGHYQAERLAPVIEVRAVSHRRNAVLQAIFPGHPDLLNLGGVTKEGNVMEAVKRVVPGVTAVHLPFSGCSRFSCYVALKRLSAADPRRAALAVFNTIEDCKLVVVVDPDIDVFNEREVLWAVVTQARLDRDLTVIPQAQGFRPWLGSAIAIIDATRPDDPDFPERSRIPQDVLARMEISAFLGS